MPEKFNLGILNFKETATPVSFSDTIIDSVFDVRVPSLAALADVLNPEALKNLNPLLTQETDKCR